MATTNHRRSVTLDWDGLLEEEDNDNLFYETRDRLSTVDPIDLEASSSSSEDEFDESRMSFSSAISSMDASKRFSTDFAVFSSQYDMWMTSPGSITERRKRLLLGMGLNEKKELLRRTSMALDRAISKKFEKEEEGINNDCNSNPSSPISTSKSPPNLSPSSSPVSKTEQKSISETEENPISKTEEKTGEGRKPCRRSRRPSIIPFVLGRLRSEGDINSFSMPRIRKEEFIGKISKQRLTRTSSDSTVSRHDGGGGGDDSCHNKDESQSANAATPEAKKRAPRKRNGSMMTAVKSKLGLGAFFLVKNLDSGKEFIVNDSKEEDGMWNKLSDIQKGKKLSMEDFEKHLGHSKTAKELMNRDKIVRTNTSKIAQNNNQNSYFSRSLRKSRRTGAALLKNIKEVASGFIGDKEKDETAKSESEKKTTKIEQWVRVRQSGKSMKELSALHLCQEFKAHEGCIWTIKFSNDGRYMASAGEDEVIHVWEVQECEVDSINTMLMERNGKEKKGRYGSKKGGNNGIPSYVHVPETVFSFSDKPYCSFLGHFDEILDLSWSKSQLLLSASTDKTVRLWDIESRTCLNVFTHSNYVTCVQFNQMDEQYFISGSLDGKVRIWNIPRRCVVDWIDTHELVTAISYTPDAQAAFVGTLEGTCRMYSTQECKLSQLGTVELRRKKKSHLRKVTGFQFSPTNPSEVLVTSADSRIRIVKDSRVVQKLLGLRNAESQISGSFSPNGRYIISGSEDSNVYIWKNDDHAKTRRLIVTNSHEQFQCKDVLLAIPWPRTIKGDPPIGPALHTKRHSKHFSSSTPNPSCSQSSPLHHSPNHKAANLPPLPKKSNHNKHDSDTISPNMITNITSGSNGAVPNTPNNTKSKWSPFFRNKVSSNNNGDHHAMVEEEDIVTMSRNSSISEDSFTSYDSTSISYGANSPPICASGRTKSSRSWSMQCDINGHAKSSSSHASAWGLVIVTAGLGGEIRCYQNFGLPKKV